MLAMIPQEYRNAAAIGAVIGLLDDHAAKDFAQATEMWDDALYRRNMGQISADQDEQRRLRERYENETGLISQTELVDARLEYDEQDSRTQALRQRNDDLCSAIRAHGMDPQTVLERLQGK